MSSRKEGAALVGVGAAACAVCCAGPILGFLAAIGLGTVIGVAMSWAIGLVVGLIAIVVVHRRRQKMRPCAASEEQAVELTPRR